VSQANRVAAPTVPPTILGLGVTGHRDDNKVLSANLSAVHAVLNDVLRRIDRLVRERQVPTGPSVSLRLHSLFADGTDRSVAAMAASLGWDIAAILPFGRDLYSTVLEVERDETAAAESLAGALADARTFALADADREIAQLLALARAGDGAAARLLDAAVSSRIATAGAVMIQQSDIVIAVWDGVTRDHVGGTGHTLHCALGMGAAVLWIDPAEPENWRILRTTEALVAPKVQGAEERNRLLADLIDEALGTEPAAVSASSMASFAGEHWQDHSERWWTAYRRVETMFGDQRPFRSLRQRYERPEDIETGSGAPTLAKARALPGADVRFVRSIGTEVMRRFAWADGISARLSDAYRGGMTINFVISAFAVFAGIAYQPLASPEQKWAFALVELLLLTTILAITALGQRRRWHARWFEGRRVAEYLRHATILLLIGAARPAGRWPKGTTTSWPEYYARHALRSLGLPEATVTSAYLHGVASEMLGPVISSQRDYHEAKATRLSRVHARLDRFSTWMFKAAVVSVGVYLLLALAASGHAIAEARLEKAAKIFTFLGVFFPVSGAAIAGIRYFGDFERFSAISEVTASKLDNLHARLNLLLAAPVERLRYDEVAELAHAADDVIVSEIESWQAVFGGKHVTVPV
jgi:hypothetical protein